MHELGMDLNKPALSTWGYFGAPSPCVFEGKKKNTPFVLLSLWEIKVEAFYAGRMRF